ncbi:MAG TPA: hypothetical protein VK029_04405 [Pseudogracilibacillus sp.]|nr:hypothetical protein [Pseudogracilibacillus sp.]
MSLSVFLLPAALAITTGLAGQLEQQVEQGEFYKINTNMKDEQIMQQALENRGNAVTVTDDQIEASIGKVDIYFQRQEDNTISAIFHKDVAVEDAREFIKNTYEEYTHVVQQNTYEKLLQRAENEGLVLQTETKQKDNTIVLTFNVER